jgi:hypothetical protein
MIPDERSNPMNGIRAQNQKLDRIPYHFSVEDAIDEEDVPRLENGDHLTRVLAELQKGLESDEHKAFVRKLTDTEPRA